jgi:yecA family protein
MADHIDLEELADYLDSDLSPDDCMGLSDLDGFLTAIFVGPELIMPSEWLPIIWGDEERNVSTTLIHPGSKFRLGSWAFC